MVITYKINLLNTTQQMLCKRLLQVSTGYITKKLKVFKTQQIKFWSFRLINYLVNYEVPTCCIHLVSHLVISCMVTYNNAVNRNMVTLGT